MLSPDRFTHSLVDATTDNYWLTVGELTVREYARQRTLGFADSRATLVQWIRESVKCRNMLRKEIARCRNNEWRAELIALLLEAS